MHSTSPRIVVGVDNSGRSDGAVVAAWEFAARIDARVELLHVAEVPHPLWQHLSEDDLRAARERSVARLAGLLAGSHVFPETVRECLSVRPGSPARELVAAAEGADWVFVGSHHREGALDFGNNLRGLLAQAPCPVWVQPGAFAPVRRVLAATDLSEQAEVVLRTARGLADRLGATLELVHVFDRPDLGYVLGYPVPFPESIVTQAREAAERGLEESAAHLAQNGVPPVARLLEGDAASELVARQSADDLLVLGTHGHTALLSAILGGVARRVLADARAPLVLVRQA
jgi:nucleotide-binding universal stress UspA family protein